MAENFYTLLTNIGKAKIANASVLGQKVNFSKLVLGDSNGNYYEPQESQVALVHQVWEGQVGSVTVDETNPNWIVIETVIPTDVGGFTIREAGLLDDTGQLLVVAKYPETYKPLATEGTVKDLIVRMIFEVSNASVVTLKIDPTVVLATKQDLVELDNKHIGLNNELDLRKASITTKELTYYVNANTGNDANDGLTTNTAFKTIQKAVDSVPEVLKHDVTINVADGTYTEEIGIYKQGIHTLRLTGNPTNKANVKINGYLNIFGSTVFINGFEITHTQGGNTGCINSYNKGLVTCTNISVKSNGSKIGFCADKFSVMLIEKGCSVDNTIGAFATNNGATLKINRDVTGSGNGWLYLNYGGIIENGVKLSGGYTGILPTATTNRVEHGGLVTGVAPQKQRLPLASGWNGNLFYYKTAENIVYVQGNLSKSSAIVNQENIAFLPVGFRPLDICTISQFTQTSNAITKTAFTSIFSNGAIQIDINYAQDLKNVRVYISFVAETW